MKLGDLKLNSPPEELAKLDSLKPQYDLSPVEKVKHYRSLFTNINPNIIVDIVNGYIVSSGVRPGYISSMSPPQISTKLMMQYFPDLRILPTVILPKISLIVKKDNPAEPPRTHDEIGQLLGYPCAGNWEQISNVSKPAIGYELVVFYNSKIARSLGLTTDSHHLFGNMCIDDSKEAEIRALAEHAKAALFAIPGMDELIDDIVVVKRRRRVQSGGKRKTRRRLRLRR